MALEIEIKAYCPHIEKLRERVLSLGAVEAGIAREEDVYYNHPSRDFGQSDEALRIRRIGGRNILTYKGPRLGGRSKTRYEQEVLVSETAEMEDILDRLGFVRVESIVKQRELFRLGAVEICIDSVEGLGDFVELETGGEDMVKAENELFALASNLGLERFERKSYLELKLEKAKA